MRIKSGLNLWFGFLSRLGLEPSRPSGLQAHAATLPILSRQLRDIGEELTREAGRVCVEFQGMAGSAKKAVGFLSGLGEADHERNVNQLVEDCRATMLTLLDRIDRDSTLCADAIEQMEMVNSTVAQVSAALQEVDRSSFASKLVAINAKIEAVHLGSRGSMFEIVAEQISAHAARSSEMAEQGTEILKKLTGAMHEATTRLNKLAMEEQEHTHASRTAVERALSDMGTARADMQGAMEKASEVTEQLASDMGRAVLRLQFQDRVSQRLEHVIQSLDLMAQAQGVASSSEPATEQPREELAASLLSSYTMDSERAVHHASGGCHRGFK